MIHVSAARSAAKHPAPDQKMVAYVTICRAFVMKKIDAVITAAKIVVTATCFKNTAPLNRY